MLGYSVRTLKQSISAHHYQGRLHVWAIDQQEEILEPPKMQAIFEYNFLQVWCLVLGPNSP